MVKRFLRSEVFRCFSASFVLVSIVCLFGPAKVYRWNLDDFVVSLTDILKITLPLGLGAWLLLLGITYAISDSKRKYFVALELAVSIGLYIQGNFLLWDYGPLNGRAIQWSDHIAKGVIEIFLWLSIGIYFFTFAKQMESKFYRIVIALFLMNWLGLALDSIQASRLWAPKIQREVSDKLYEFSTRQNVLLVLLDGFQSTALPKILERSPELKAELSGFTFYKDHLGAYENTAMSVPAILSGQFYTNGENQNKFFKRSLEQKSLPYALSAAGLDVRLGLMDRYCAYYPAENCASLSAVSERDSWYNQISEVAKIFDITLFRYSPHFLKMQIYNQDQWWLRRLTFHRNRPGYFWHKRAILTVENFEELGRLGGTQASFKMLHMLIPHSPFQVDGSCKDFEDQKLPDSEKYLGQAECALKLGLRLVHKLRDLGILDETMVILTADHGLGFDYLKESENTKIFEREQMVRPLLLIKPFFSKHPFEISNIPTSIVDIPKTIMHSLGSKSDFAGEIIGPNIPKNRVRHFFKLEAGGASIYGTSFLPPLQEYLIKGSAFDLKSWTKEPLHQASPNLASHD
jgi:hypothetical protein